MVGLWSDDRLKEGWDVAVQCFAGNKHLMVARTRCTDCQDALGWRSLKPSGLGDVAMAGRSSYMVDNCSRPVAPAALSV